MSRAIFIVIFALTCLTFLTEAVLKSYYIQCKDSPNSSSNIRSLSITNCNTPPCLLKKGTTVSVEEVFSVNKDISKLKTRVFAKTDYGIFPFLSVNNQDACPNIYNMNDTKAECPLRANGIYKYKNEFFIYRFYPNVEVTVTWKLIEEVNQNKSNVISCFEVDARIKI
ncbi:NPC intracellular cholesterol transporter 2 homolog a [Cotesia glomerata]|uniref:NPC intracellular cholesterol transporter 2 homolog a n=1 Tax=Cotesia glomerata TaxID=32391 RepID=UPI001D013572|nr:NPC intracellular cholesterol transporter 2 homolog a [Cotesia glomerata]